MNAIEAADFLEHGSRHLSRVERVETARILREMHEALEPFARAPLRGIYGGPLVQAKLIYEDSTDEDTAWHRGRLIPSHFRRARKAYEAKP